jgi:hypothetical protein
MARNKRELNPGCGVQHKNGSNIRGSTVTIRFPEIRTGVSGVTNAVVANGSIVKIR